MFNGGTGFTVPNPFMAMLLGQVAAEQPSLVAGAASSMGVPPPIQRDMPGASSFGNLFSPVAAAPATGGHVPGVPFPEGITTAFGGSGSPSFGTAPQQAGPGVPDIAKAIGSMAGVKAPGAAPAPIMNAGVSGSQKAPELTASGAGGSTMLQLLKMLQGSAGPASTPVGSLGSYF